MNRLSLRDGEVKSVEDDDDEEEGKEGNDCDQRLTKNIDPSKFVVDSEWLAVVLNSVFLYKIDHRSSDSVQISEMKSIRELSNSVRLHDLDVTEKVKNQFRDSIQWNLLEYSKLDFEQNKNLLGSFWKDDLDLCLLNNHISG